MTLFQIILLNWFSLISTFFFKRAFDKTQTFSLQQVNYNSKSTDNSETNPKLESINVVTEKNNEQKYLKELNKEDVYLLVTDGFPDQGKIFNKNDTKQNKLLLIHTQDRLSNTLALKESRFNKIFLKGKQKGFFLQSRDKYKNKSIWAKGEMFPIEIPNMAEAFYPGPLSFYFRSPKVYYRHNRGGYKSICPVFFDKNQAEFFLKHVYEENLKLLSILPSQTQSDIFQGICGTKIIQVGMGDFINFYVNKESNVLTQVDFLFFPKEKEIKKVMRWNSLKFFSSGKHISCNSFYSYAKSLNSYKNYSKKYSLNEWKYNINLTESLKNSQSYLDYYYNKYKDNFLTLEPSEYKFLGGKKLKA